MLHKLYDGHTAMTLDCDGTLHLQCKACGCAYTAACPGTTTAQKMLYINSHTIWREFQTVEAGLRRNGALESQSS